MDFQTLWTNHRQIYVAILILTGLSGLLWTPTLYSQLVILVLGVVLIGIAHGAIDYRFGQDLLEPIFGKPWFLPFAGFYLSLGLLMLSIWLFNARMALLLFLFLAIPHFGLEDVQTSEFPAIPGTSIALSMGCLPIALPAYFSPQTTMTVFNYLLPESQQIGLTIVQLGGKYLFLLAMIAVLSVALFSEVSFQRWSPSFIEIGGLVFVFGTAEPILAFTIYYCVGHSFREMLEIMDELYTGTLFNRLAQFYLETLPIALTTIIIGGLTVYFLSVLGLKIQAMAAIVVFVGLSVVLIPHMVFDVLHERYA